MKLLARWISQGSRRRTGIEIHPGAKIGRRLVIDHGMGIVIGETAEIGDDCLLYQGVTLGGTGKDTGKRHPTIGNNVLIGCGAKVLGPFAIGDNSRVAANAVVLNAIPPNSTAVGSPARVVRKEGEKTDFVGDVDQIHIEDPTTLELRALRAELEEIKRALYPKKITG
jgi:serine O-acetyltransferase